jgi:hypothetical protein
MPARSGGAGRRLTLQCPVAAEASVGGGTPVGGEPIGVPLVLRHASKRSSGTWGPDDYDVLQGDWDIGRIFKARAGVPPDYPWMWTITGAVVMPALPSHGFCASLDEAKTKFAETWRGCLAVKSDRFSSHTHGMSPSWEENLMARTGTMLTISTIATAFAFWLVALDAEGAAPTRTRVDAPLTLYVDPEIGSDDPSNLCTSATSPCRTPQAAYRRIMDDYDHAGFLPTIQLADGDYESCINAFGVPLGAHLVNIRGHVGDASAVRMRPVRDGQCFVAQDLAILNIGHLSVEGGVFGFVTRQHGGIDVGQVVLGNLATAFIAQSNSWMNIVRQIVVAGDHQVHWSATDLSRITIASNVTYSYQRPVQIGHFAAISGLSILECLGTLPLSGPVTGKAYHVTGNSELRLNGNTMPGTIAGTVDTGGQVHRRERSLLFCLNVAVIRERLVKAGVRLARLLDRALRHASKRSSGTWGPDDCDVIHDGWDIGRIVKPGAGVPPDHPWMWTITGAIVMPALPSHGFCASLDEAKAKFVKTCRAWLAGRRKIHLEYNRDCVGSYRAAGIRDLMAGRQHGIAATIMSPCPSVESTSKQERQGRAPDP